MIYVMSDIHGQASAFYKMLKRYAFQVMTRCMY